MIYLNFDTVTGLPIASSQWKYQGMFGTGLPKLPTGNLNYNAALFAISNLDYVALSRDDVMNKLGITLMVKVVADRGELRKLANQDAALLNEFQDLSKNIAIAKAVDAGAASLLAAAAAANLLPPLIGQTVSAVLVIAALVYEPIDALTWWNRAKAWHDELDTHAAQWNTVANAGLGINLQGVALVDEYHHEDILEGEGALHNLVPKYSDDPRASVDYWYMVTTWINLASAIVVFYENITEQLYEGLVAANNVGQLAQVQPNDLEQLTQIENSLDLAVKANDLATIESLTQVASKEQSADSDSNNFLGISNTTWGIVAIGVVLLVAVGFLLYAK